jgi:hypothetical protein
MLQRLGLYICVAGSIFLGAATTRAAFTLVDNFEASTLGLLEGQIAPGTNNPWVTINNTSGTSPSIAVIAAPSDSLNPANTQAVRFTTASNQIAYNQLGALTTGESSTPGTATGTLFFRIRLDPQTQNLGVGWSDGLAATTGDSTAAPTSTNFDNFEMFLNQDGNSAGLGNSFRVRNGTAFNVITPENEDNVWYNVWFVAKNLTGQTTGDVYDAYLQGGTNFPTQTLIGENLQFRANSATNEVGGGPLDYFLARQGGDINTANGTNGAFYIDDIYIDVTGQNLANPVPEPSTLALAGLAVLGLILHQRRRIAA